MNYTKLKFEIKKTSGDIYLASITLYIDTKYSNKNLSVTCYLTTNEIDNALNNGFDIIQSKKSILLQEALNYGHFMDEIKRIEKSESRNIID